jgi:hypothetical protein
MAMTNGARTGPSRESASVEWLRVVAVQDDVVWRLSLDGGRRTAHSTALSTQHTAGNGRWREDSRGGLARELSESCRLSQSYQSYHRRETATTGSAAVKYSAALRAVCGQRCTASGLLVVGV